MESIYSLLCKKKNNKRKIEQQPVANGEKESQILDLNSTATEMFYFGEHRFIISYFKSQITCIRYIQQNKVFVQRIENS